MKKLLFIATIMLALVGCNKPTQNNSHGSSRKATLCKAGRDSVMCTTMTGATVNPLRTLQVYDVIPEAEFDYGEDDYEILSPIDQYIHLDKDCTDSLIFQLVDIYNGLTMTNSILNDMEVTERYEITTSAAMTQQDCSTIHNPSLRKQVERFRNACALANKTMDTIHHQIAKEALGIEYELLNVVVDPIIVTSEQDYCALCDRSTYMVNYDEFKSKRGSNDETYQKQLLATYAQTTDFDWKCIWALEFAHSSELHMSFLGGAALLEEVMLSKTYSPYLDEVWATWRAIVSTQFGLSNYSYIPNIFYNKLRLTCATTMLHHIQNHHDDILAQGVFINLAIRDNIVRHGGLFGNSAISEQMEFFPEWNTEEEGE